MKTEKEKMLAGELYDALDSELVGAREQARDLCQNLNATRERELETRRQILIELLGSGGDSVWMQHRSIAIMAATSTSANGSTSTSTALFSTCARCESATLRSLVQPFRFTRALTR